MFDWNDVKALLAVGRGGSTAAAARELGVNQTTVSRRLEALERDLGVKLVERSQTGASLTPEGLSLVEDAEAMERGAAAMSQKVEVHRRGVAGVVRVTISEMTANEGLTPYLPEFRSLYPDVKLELVITDAALDLEAGDADIAIRGATALADSNLVARKVSETKWALYCSQAYAQRVGLPTDLEQLHMHTLIGSEIEERDPPGLGPLLRRMPGTEITLRTSSLTQMFISIKAGLGIGPMPCIVADVDPDLVQVFAPLEDSQSYTWMVTRPDLTDAPRVRAFMDFFAPKMIALTRDLERRAAELRASRA